MIDLESKSPETEKRIKSIKTEIRHHTKSIQRLKEHAAFLQQAAYAPHAPRIVKYSCIPRSEKRFQWTIEHITSQVALLEKELETLIQHGK